MKQTFWVKLTACFVAQCFFFFTIAPAFASPNPTSFGISHSHLRTPSLRATDGGARLLQDDLQREIGSVADGGKRLAGQAELPTIDDGLIRRLEEKFGRPFSEVYAELTQRQSPVECRLCFVTGVGDTNYVLQEQTEKLLSGGYDGYGQAIVSKIPLPKGLDESFKYVIHHAKRAGNAKMLRGTIRAELEAKLREEIAKIYSVKDHNQIRLVVPGADIDATGAEGRKAKQKQFEVNSLKAIIPAETEGGEARELTIEQVGIGHTRWATVGPVSDKNAHPFLVHREDLDLTLALVHNGNFNNSHLYKEVMVAQEEGGNPFRQESYFTSDTDSEIFAHLVSLMAKEKDGKISMKDAVRRAFRLVQDVEDWQDTSNFLQSQDARYSEAQRIVKTKVSTELPALSEGADLTERIGEHVTTLIQKALEDLTIYDEGRYTHYEGELFSEMERVLFQDYLINKNIEKNKTTINRWLSKLQEAAKKVKKGATEEELKKKLSESLLQPEVAEDTRDTIVNGYIEVQKHKKEIKETFYGGTRASTFAVALVSNQGLEVIVARGQEGGGLAIAKPTEKGVIYGASENRAFAGFVGEEYPTDRSPQELSQKLNEWGRGIVHTRKVDDRELAAVVKPDPGEGMAGWKVAIENFIKGEALTEEKLQERLKEKMIDLKGLDLTRDSWLEREILAQRDAWLQTIYTLTTVKDLEGKDLEKEKIGLFDFETSHTRNEVNGLLEGKTILPNLPHLNFEKNALKGLTDWYLVGVGTSTHLAQIIQALLGPEFNIAIHEENALSFAANPPKLVSAYEPGGRRRILVTGISNSGETEETRQALEYVKKKNAGSEDPILLSVITNVPGSTIDEVVKVKREGEEDTPHSVYTINAFENSVAATGSFAGAIIATVIMATDMMLEREEINEEQASERIGRLIKVARILKDEIFLEKGERVFVNPELKEKVLDLVNRTLGRYDKPQIWFSGLGPYAVIARESQLKAQEGWRLDNVKGYAANIGKHGPYVELKPGMTAVLYIGKDKNTQQMIQALGEMRDRTGPMDKGGPSGLIVAVVDEGRLKDDSRIKRAADIIVPLPMMDDPVTGSLMALVFDHLFTVYGAYAKYNRVEKELLVKIDSELQGKLESSSGEVLEKFSVSLTPKGEVGKKLAMEILTDLSLRKPEGTDGPNEAFNEKIQEAFLKIQKGGSARKAVLEVLKSGIIKNDPALKAYAAKKKEALEAEWKPYQEALGYVRQLKEKGVDVKRLRRRYERIVAMGVRPAEAMRFRGEHFREFMVDTPIHIAKKISGVTDGGVKTLRNSAADIAERFATDPQIGQEAFREKIDLVGPVKLHIALSNHPVALALMRELLMQENRERAFKAEEEVRQRALSSEMPPDMVDELVHDALSKITYPMRPAEDLYLSESERLSGVLGGPAAQNGPAIVMSYRRLLLDSRFTSNPGALRELLQKTKGSLYFTKPIGRHFGRLINLYGNMIQDLGTRFVGKDLMEFSDGRGVVLLLDEMDRAQFRIPEEGLLTRIRVPGGGLVRVSPTQMAIGPLDAFVVPLGAPVDLLKEAVLGYHLALQLPDMADLVQLPDLADLEALDAVSKLLLAEVAQNFVDAQRLLATVQAELIQAENEVTRVLQGL